MQLCYIVYGGLYAINSLKWLWLANIFYTNIL